MIHQTGWRSSTVPFEDRAARFRASGVPGEMQPFLDDMPATFAQASLIVSRAGMGAVSEIAASGRPSILVPLPTASDQHQLRNAEAFAHSGAARLVLDHEMDGGRFFEEVGKLASQPGTLKHMGEQARTFAHPGAARRAAEIVEEAIAAPAAQH